MTERLFTEVTVIDATTSIFKKKKEKHSHLIRGFHKLDKFGNNANISIKGFTM